MNTTDRRSMYIEQMIKSELLCVARGPHEMSPARNMPPVVSTYAAPNTPLHNYHVHLVLSIASLLGERDNTASLTIVLW